MLNVQFQLLNANRKNIMLNWKICNLNIDINIIGLSELFLGISLFWIFIVFETCKRGEPILSSEDHII